MIYSAKQRKTYIKRIVLPGGENKLNVSGKPMDTVSKSKITRKIGSERISVVALLKKGRLD